jgi:hypothetical protein
VTAIHANEIPLKYSFEIPTKFNEVLFRHSSKIKVITTAILEAATLVLLMGGFYKDRFRGFQTFGGGGAYRHSDTDSKVMS